jgi:hypothetical protein
MPMRCPNPECETETDCDACLDRHLRRAHGLRYRDVFGPAPSCWLGTCSHHEAVPRQRLGAVDDTLARSPA